MNKYVSLKRKSKILQTRHFQSKRRIAVSTIAVMCSHTQRSVFASRVIIIRCQIWNRHWRPCLSKHLCHQTTSKNLNPYFVHLLPSYKDYQEMLFVVCPYRVCLLLYQLKIRIPSLYVYTHVLKIPFASRIGLQIDA